MTAPETEPPATHLSRRTMIKRGAAMGGAIAWTAPAVQVIGLGKASAQSASVPNPPPDPPPPPPEPPAQCQDISNIQIIVSKDGTYYGLKYDPGDAAGDRFTAWSAAAPDSNDCIRYYVDATGNAVVAKRSVASAFNSDDGDGTPVVDVISDCEWRLRLPLPSGYTYVAGYLKYGNVATGGCPPAGTPGATYVAFSTT